MPMFKMCRKLFPLAFVLCWLPLAAAAQEPEKTPPGESEEVLRVTSDLIQTGVGVFDKNGKFVRDLRQEDFALRVDGQPVSITFFERVSENGVTVGQNRRAEKNVDSPAQNSSLPPPALGRTIIFLADDMHLSFDSLRRTREVIAKFVEQDMRAGDAAAIVSTSGKIGFLQQFTDERNVLRAALSRLIFNRDYSSGDRLNPPMSPYEAQLIERYDQEVTDVFANWVIRESPGTTLEVAREQVRQRALTVLSQTALVNRNMFAALEQAVRRTEQLPGRKIVFFFSDGFLLDPANTDSSYRLRRITDAATRANAVVYSFDAKGLEAGFPENTAGSFRVQSGERFETGDGLSELAVSTGGRFIRNTNDLTTGVAGAIAEASEYYLLAWQPETENAKPETLRKIEVVVRNRPDLTVRFQAGYLVEKKSAAAENAGRTEKPAQSPADTLAAALNAPVARQALPTALAANYMDVPGEGAIVTAALQFRGGALDFAPGAEERTAKIDLVGVIYNADGERSGYFRELITTSVTAAKFAEFGGADVFYNYRAKLKPGLYQVRVAARDLRSGRTGSAVRWVEVPDLSKRRLALSSLLVGAAAKKGDSSADAVAGIDVSVERRFRRADVLRYVVFIYNAARASGGAPDVSVETQILRGDKALLSAPARRVSADGQDATRLAYAAEIPLSGLPSGAYELVLRIGDRTTKEERRVKFEVE